MDHDLLSVPDRLPPELWYQIFMTTSLSDLKSVALVCKAFYSLVKPILWNSPSISPVTRVIPKEVIQNMRSIVVNLQMVFQFSLPTGEFESHRAYKDVMLELLQYCDPDRLKTLTVKGCFCDNMLTTISTFRTLTVLDISGCLAICDVPSESLRFICNLPLQKLCIRDTMVTDEFLSYIGSLKQLRFLDMALNGRIGSEAMQCLSNLQHLQYLDISECYAIKSAGLWHLIDLPLKELILCDMFIDLDLKPIGHLSKLQTLNLKYNERITNANLVHIGQCLELQSLNISYCVKIDAEGLEGISHLPLRYLNVAHISADDTCLQVICKFTELTCLDLSANRAVTDDSFVHVASLTKLRKLTLDNCHLVEVTGLGVLSKLPLKYLSLEKCQLNVSKMQAIGHLASLTSLNLASNEQLGNIGLSCIEGLHNIRQLDITNCSISTTYLQQFQSIPRDHTLIIRDQLTAQMCDLLYWGM